MKTELEGRTLEFAVHLIGFVSRFPRPDVATVVGRQLLRAGASVGANYREANRAESKDDFVHKTGLVQKEAAETDYWLEICSRVRLGDENDAAVLAKEARELLAIFTMVNRRAKGR